MPHSQCTFCGGPADGSHTIPRDGLECGPDVPLCDACADEESGPTNEEIWERISTLVWVEKPAIQSILSRHEGTTFVNGRAPAWQFGLACAYAHCTMYVSALQLEFKPLFDTVERDSDLQNAVTAAVRFGAQGLEILMMITQAQDNEQSEDNDQPGITVLRS